MTIAAIIRRVRDHLRIEDHAALLGTGVAIGLAVLSLTMTGNDRADVAAIAAAVLTFTIVGWYAAKLARRNRR